MEHSASLAKLFTALSQFQSEVHGVAKDGENPFFKSGYATLTSVWSTIREPLHRNGLSLVQTTLPNENGVVIRTILGHVSGEYISGDLFMRPAKNDPQAVGSAISYARRYAISAMVGLYDKDDDGELAMSRSTPVQTIPKGSPSISSQSSPPIRDSLGEVKPSYNNNRVYSQSAPYKQEYKPNPGKMISDKQHARLVAIAKSKGWTMEEVLNLVVAKFDKMNTHALDQVSYEEVIEIIQNQTYPQASGLEQAPLNLFDPGPTDSDIPF